MQDVFLAGVVEGFYGKPWSQTQRLDLFQNLKGWGLNTYFYSPKDDLKHRAAWRESYSDAEVSSLQELVNGCNEQNIEFFYGLSPGLDIRFSDAKEHETLRRRFQQMIGIGVRHFALLFDDLPGKMQPEDLKKFSSVAEAQSHVANLIFEWLRSRVTDSRMLFCPTPYCDRMVSWKLGGNDYLDQLGSTLHPEIDILWTGTEIIAPDITPASLQPIADRIRRKPVIWDNLHANDYDLRRHYCGPYSRDVDMKHHVRGILSNPNNEYPLNYIPLRTLSEYLHAENYTPRQAFEAAIKDWAERYQTVGDPISENDLKLIADCYYLPYAQGDSAESLCNLIRNCLQEPEGQQDEKYEQLQIAHQQVTRIFDHLTQLRDRELFYAWSRRIWELREELDLVKDFVDARRSGKLRQDSFQSETHLHGTCRGGMVAELQRMLTMQEGQWRVQK